MMKIQKIIFALTIVSFLAVGCKTEAKKDDATKEEKTEVAANTKELSLSISGMTCEIGCAKTIESKLSKTEGVNVVSISFDDKKGIIEYDANKTDEDKIVAVVQKIAGGDLYKVTGTKLIGEMTE